MEKTSWRVLLMSAILVSTNFKIIRADDQLMTTVRMAGGQEASLLCISECGTCPTICSSPPPPALLLLPPPVSINPSPPPPPPLSLPPPPPSPKSGSSSSPSAPSHSSPLVQTRGGLSNNYYYFYTAGSIQSCAVSSIHTLLFLVFLYVMTILQ